MFTENPMNDILFNKATACLQENNYEEAIEIFTQLIEKEPENVNCLNGKGSALMQAGRIDEAEDIFNRSLNIKDNPMAYLNKAIISGNKMNYDEAIEYCDKVIELYSELKDVALSLKENLIKQKNVHTDSDEFSDEARELIDRANALKEEDEYWQGDEHYNSVASETPKFKKITFWDAWELYEQAIKKDPKCESVAVGHITEIKSSLMENFLFFDITNHDDFNPQSERDTLKMKIMGEILISKGFLKARAMTSQLLTTDENDLDALNYKGALSFYYDDLDEAIECFDKLAQSGNGVYLFYGDFNRAFVLRRKAMLTGDLEYMVQALDIYDEMLKDSMTFDLVKPYQREILDKLQEFMNVPLF